MKLKLEQLENRMTPCSNAVPDFDVKELVEAYLQALEQPPSVPQIEIPDGAMDRGRPDEGSTEVPTEEQPPEAQTEADRVVEIVNAIRVENGLEPLKVNDKLTEAAQAYAEEILSTGNFEHGDVGARLDAVGYEWSAYGENIANGYSDAEQVVAGWMDSPGHRSNILDPNFTEIGVGFADGYWVQDFGRR